MTKLIALLGFTSLLLQSTTASWVGPGAPPAKEPEEWAGPGKRADAANAAAYIPDVDGQNAHEWNKRAEPWDTPPPADSSDAHEWNKKTVREKNEADFVPDKSHDWLKRDVKRDDAPGDLIWTAPGEDSNDSHEWGKRKAAPAAADFEWGAPGEDSNDSHEWGKRQVHKRIDTFKIVEIRIEGPKEGTVKNAGLWERSALSDAVPGDTWKRDLDGIYGQAAKQNFALDSRGMVEAWMNPRSLSKRQCQTAGYQVCAGKPPIPIHPSMTVN